MSASSKLLWHLWVVQSRLPTGDSHYQGSRKKVKFGYLAAPFLFFFSSVLLHPSPHLGRAIIYITTQIHVQMFAHPFHISHTLKKFLPCIFVWSDTGSPL